MASQRCMFKLDLQKAYDSIEWSFVDQMLQALKFPEKFKQLLMVCITSPTYTLSLNGAQFGFFKGKRGLRQGDPISLLIFCICMEYLSRITAFATDKWYFRYHPLCKSLKLTHLLFSDDLLMFCKGDPKSIILVLRVLFTFYAAYGLKVNASKSEVVFNGVSQELKQEITQVSGFREGILSFKYLGIPIQPGRLTRQDCNILLERITARVRSVGARKLSYAAWDKVCCSKKEGGFNIKEAGVWNIATVGKLVNWIYTKADRFWVLWIDHVYMKGADWHSYTPPTDSNWNWRNICRVKDTLRGGYVTGQWMPNSKGYSVGNGYHWLQGPRPPAQWYKTVWDSWNVPKHSFKGWLVMQRGLQTREKLMHLGICDHDRCVLCEQDVETHSHLFRLCTYSSQIISGIEKWIHLSLQGNHVGYSKLQKSVCRMACMTCWYYIWQERNSCRLKLVLNSPDKMITELKKLIRTRIMQKIDPKLPNRDRGWLLQLHVHL
ncbi:uncharacterized protein LOC141655560 [Silene latifolia]|uniref:uncharacterized protein LOC141655560 n=1 Tax=Silene latifolia TaxID=37657 RepID=UPI003D77D3FF